MKLPESLKGKKNVVLDTMFFIYLFEDAPKYAECCEFLMRAAERGDFSGLITPITVAELLVKPLSHNRGDLADRYRQTLSSYQNIYLADMTAETGCLAAALRARYRLPLPDMIQAAFALQSAHPVLITNDVALRPVKEVKVLLLDEMI